jgi:hypothetical protein
MSTMTGMGNVYISVGTPGGPQKQGPEPLFTANSGRCIAYWRLPDPRKLALLA